jgi:hypothetical protein
MAAVIVRHPMKYSVRHGISDHEKVRSVIERAYEAYQARLADYHPRLRWVTDSEARVSFTALGRTLEPRFFIDDEFLRVEGDIPLLFRPFKSKIERVLGDEIDKWLKKVREGEI